MGIDSALVDLRYAIRQLRDFGCIRRALDALERVEEVLESHDPGEVEVADLYIPDDTNGNPVVLPAHIRVFRNDSPPFRNDQV